MNRGLHVVAHHAGAAAAGGHRACVGIRQRHLLIRRDRELAADRLELLHLLANCRDLLLEALYPGLRYKRGITVCEQALKFDQVVNPPRRLTHQADLAAPEAVTRLRQSTEAV